MFWGQIQTSFSSFISFSSVRACCSCTLRLIDLRTLATSCNKPADMVVAVVTVDINRNIVECASTMSQNRWEFRSETVQTVTHRSSSTEFTVNCDTLVPSRDADSVQWLAFGRFSLFSASDEFSVFACQHCVCDAMRPFLSIWFRLLCCLPPNIAFDIYHFIAINTRFSVHCAPLWWKYEIVGIIMKSLGADFVYSFRLFFISIFHTARRRIGRVSTRPLRTHSPFV